MSDILKLENQLCHRFYTISNALTRAYRPLLNELDITYPQYIVMMALWEADKITIASLLDKTKMDGGAMSLILKKLEQKQYLEVKKDEIDKRVRRVFLTEKAKAAKSKAEAIPMQMVCKLNGLTTQEMLELKHLMDKLQSCFPDE